MNLNDIDAFLASYIETALWSSHDQSRPDGGDPMDDNYSEDDIHPDTLKRMREECLGFIEENAGLLAPFAAHSCGHDFWLNRNGHGAGFWDGDYDDAGDALSDACKPWGTCDLYVGDDGMVHA